ncbi:MAG TPA: hypothetical protein PLC04_06410 [Candidatus Kapabacteria bacterium]|nr:hypothetical protein [Candidatus Kapabacteria bacterium]HOV92690.1 hypothetical protein [Candidatus Kapabacteria bacterium]
MNTPQNEPTTSIRRFKAQSRIIELLYVAAPSWCRIYGRGLKPSIAYCSGRVSVSHLYGAGTCLYVA